MAHNYVSAFVQFCQGVPVEEISVVCDIPMEILKRHVSEQKWQSLATKVQTEARVMALSGTTLPGIPDRAEAKAKLIQENRERNYQLWCQLRDDAAILIGELGKPGGLRFKRYWHNKGEIVDKECQMTMGDRTALANYLQMIAIGTYQSLGDKAIVSGAREDGSTLNPSTAPAITIVLPGAIAYPRNEREVVDVQAVSVPKALELLSNTAA